MSKHFIFDDVRSNRSIEASLQDYMDFLIDSNQYTNLISRKITRDRLVQLVRETTIINPLISKSGIVDAGSGNGLLGIPLAVMDSRRPVILVETKAKKVEFLKNLCRQMDLTNVYVYEGAIDTYLARNKSTDFSLVSRGFPKIELLLKQLKKGLVGEVLLITSQKKIIKMRKGIERMQQKIYNIPFRDNIVILKMENVSRET